MRAVSSAFCLAGLIASAVGKAIVQPPTFTNVRSLVNTSTSRIAVPFGTLDGVKSTKPSLVQTAESEYDPSKTATDEAWEKYVRKGRWYGCILDMTDEQAGKALGDRRTPQSAESLWQGDLRNDIFRWGWYDAFYDPEISCDFRDQVGLASNNKIETVLRALGLSYLPFGRGGDNECFSVEHFDENLLPKDDESDEEENNMDDNEHGAVVPIEEQTYKVGNDEYPCTGAYYRFAVNRKGGAMFAQALQKPQAAAKENLGPNIPESKMPQLQRASDIMWSYWERNNPGPQDLRYYFVNHIRNDETNPLVARALKSYKSDKVPYWPGLELGMETEEAEAILGSPIGSTIAHLLFQHKKTLGVKNIASITIFRDNYPPNWAAEVHLLFKIIDVPFDEQIDEDVEMPDAPDAKAKRMMRVVDDSGKSVVREHRIVVRL